MAIALSKAPLSPCQGVVSHGSCLDHSPSDAQALAIHVEYWAGGFINHRFIPAIPWQRGAADECAVTSDGELEPEVDEDKIITDQDRKEALELKAKANKAFGGKSPWPALAIFGAEGDITLR